MNTTTEKPVESQIVIANLIQNTIERRSDYRYETYQSLRNKKGGLVEKITYWIGVIDLDPIRKSTRLSPILIPSNKWELIADTYTRRHVDGAVDEYGIPIMYYVDKIIITLNNERDLDKKYFIVFLEEIVSHDGRHKINLLLTRRNEVPVYGIPSNVPWWELSTKEMAGFSYQEIHQHLERICILQNDPYRWLK